MTWQNSLAFWSYSKMEDLSWEQKCTFKTDCTFCLHFNEENVGYIQYYQIYANV